MTTDLETQRRYAEALVEVLNDFIECYPTDETDEDGRTIDSWELDPMAVLDALGCCGLTLQPGQDAGMAYLDRLIVTKHN